MLAFEPSASDIRLDLPVAPLLVKRSRRETMEALDSKRILVTGGTGFLGSKVVERLKNEGCKQVLVFRSSEYDLRKPVETGKLFRDTRPQIVIHLAAAVGGIGANRVSPGRFFYDNLMMGVEVF